MRENYDFSKSVKNPYSKQLKEQVTIDLEKDVIQYFEEIAQETGISYLSLINLYLRECMENKRKLSLIESNH
ncbi:antitoxin [Anabaena sphaerica FACHB-251]|uniref:Antitoxin n=1 Tax=Anabaena sphaerica FACHB-251 TaxID=2692883 RepID=A0A926WJ76_9NOST|nr:antitoxin [Anabaena sphaerica]MBD2294446.1 antitoxin [Anabaena sphaerica FACHB-251]